MLSLSLKITFNWNGFRNKMQESDLITTSAAICIIYQAGDLWRDTTWCFSLLTVIFPDIHFECRHTRALRPVLPSSSAKDGKKEALSDFVSDKVQGLDRLVILWDCHAQQSLGSDKEKLSGIGSDFVWTQGRKGKEETISIRLSLLLLHKVQWHLN